MQLQVKHRHTAGAGPGLRPGLTCAVTAGGRGGQSHVAWPPCTGSSTHSPHISLPLLKCCIFHLQTGHTGVQCWEKMTSQVKVTTRGKPRHRGVNSRPQSHQLTTGRARRTQAEGAEGPPSLSSGLQARPLPGAASCGAEAQSEAHLAPLKEGIAACLPPLECASRVFPAQGELPVNVPRTRLGALLAVGIWPLLETLGLVVLAQFGSRALGASACWSAGRGGSAQWAARATRPPPRPH